MRTVTFVIRNVCSLASRHSLGVTFFRNMKACISVYRYVTTIYKTSHSRVKTSDLYHFLAVYSPLQMLIHSVCGPYCHVTVDSKSLKRTGLLHFPLDLLLTKTIWHNTHGPSPLMYGHCEFMLSHYSWPQCQILKTNIVQSKHNNIFCNIQT
jgi:hypothetical protein